ncbi:transposase [Streptomyces sp. NBC_00342]|uniref:transposase n=1 Tax=Streptomyces sp. NBC_00342 TaxID=2975718 RepID=UPI003FA6F9ED
MVDVVWGAAAVPGPSRNWTSATPTFKRSRTSRTSRTCGNSSPPGRSATPLPGRTEGNPARRAPAERSCRAECRTDPAADEAGTSPTVAGQGRRHRVLAPLHRTRARFPPDDGARWSAPGSPPQGTPPPLQDPRPASRKWAEPEGASQGRTGQHPVRCERPAPASDLTRELRPADALLPWKHRAVTCGLAAPVARRQAAGHDAPAVRPAGRQRYARTHNGIEGALSRAVHTTGLWQCRYRRLARTRLQHQLTAAGTSLARLGARTTKRPRAHTRTSHLAAFRPVG